MSSEQLGGVLAQRYEIEARIGAGGMGEVYRARDRTLARTVAIKRLAPALAAEPRHRDRLLQEARSAARVNHQGLAAVYDVLEHEDQFLLVMEYVEGETLRDHLRSPIAHDDALDIMIECAAGLAAAHRAGIIHYDLKPANIMMTPEGRPKILDFGLAQIAAAAVDPEGSTVGYLNTSREIVGTPPYMAPEVLLGKKADARADLFSLGVVFYELLTGQNPFRAPTATAVADLILHLAPPPVQRLAPSVPARFQPILDKLLAKSPRQRYATADDLLVDLRALRASLTAAGPIATTAAGSPTPHRGWLAAALLAGTVLVAALATTWWPSGDNGAPGASTAAAGDPGDPARMFLAVLPIAPDATQPGASAVIQTGLATTITTRLTQLTREHPFQMVAASSMRPVATVAEARLQFGVNRVLTFMLIEQQLRVRANLELVDAASGVQLAADSIDGSLDDLLGFQDTVARRILRMLQIQLRPIERDMLDAGTESREAYGYYVSATGYLSLASVEDLEVGVQQFRHALRLDPGFVAAHAGLGRTAIYLAEFTGDTSWIDTADEACRAALSGDPLSAEAHDCHGSVLRARGELDAAVAAFEESFRLDPTSYNVVRGLAGVYAELGREEEAERLYLEAIEALPHHSAPYGWLATFYLRRGRLDDAIGHYERAADLAPDAFRTLTNLGSAYFFADRWGDAKGAWQRVTALNPDYAAARSNLGTVLFYEGDYQGAADQFARAVELSPERYVYWGNLGDARWFAPGPRETARAAFERGIELVNEQIRVNPTDPGARVALSYYLAMLDRGEPARSHLDQVLGSEPTDGAVLYKAAQTAQRLGESERAMGLLERAIAAGASASQLRADPMFTPLRDDARYRRIAGR